MRSARISAPPAPLGKSNLREMDTLGIVVDLHDEGGRNLAQVTVRQTGDPELRNLIRMADALGKRYLIAAGRFNGKGIFAALCDDEQALIVAFQVVNARMDEIGSCTTAATTSHSSSAAERCATVALTLMPGWIPVPAPLAQRPKEMTMKNFSNKKLAATPQVATISIRPAVPCWWGSMWLRWLVVEGMVIRTTCRCLPRRLCRHLTTCTSPVYFTLLTFNSETNTRLIGTRRLS